MDTIDQLMERITKNLSDYHAHIKGLDKQEIIDMAGKINAMNDAHYYLTEHHAFTYEDAEYLLQFKNPLEIVADKWEARISDISDMSFDINKVLSDKSAEKDGYALADAADAPAPAKTSPAMPFISSRLLTEDVFTEKMRELFPAGRPDALSSILDYAANISDSEVDATQFYLETAAEFTLVKRLYGEKVGTQLLNLAATDDCLNPSEIRRAANLLHRGVTVNAILAELDAGRLVRTDGELQESLQEIGSFIETVTQEAADQGEAKPTLLDKRLAEHEFTKEINELLPGHSPAALTCWANYAHSLAFDGKQTAEQGFKELTATLASVKQEYGVDIATKVFHVALEMPIPVSEFHSAAAHLKNGGDINDIVELSLAGKLKPIQEIPESPLRTDHQPVDVQAEADRIVAAVKSLSESNSPSKTHYAVPVSHDFMFHASTQDLDRLLNALPYKRPALTRLDGQKGIFVTVPKKELEKSSLLGRLSDATQKAAAQNKQKASPDKSKKADRSEI